jgi:hypothetical protein
MGNVLETEHLPQIAQNRIFVTRQPKTLKANQN